MIRQLAEERPVVQPGPADWFLGGSAGSWNLLINQRLGFGVQVELSGFKNQPRANAYTDLLATVFYSDNPRIVFTSCLPTIAIISTASLFRI